MKTIAITIEDDILKRIDLLIEHSPESPINRSKFIRQAIAEHLARLDRIAEDEREAVIFYRNRLKLEREAKALVREQAKP